jgi:hypothetical protein
MPEIDASFYTEQQWQIAKRSLENEFDIQFEKIQVKDQVKKLFFNYVSLHKFSSDACIALYYRLFFFSTLILVQIIENEGFEFEDFELGSRQLLLESFGHSLESRAKIEAFTRERHSMIC